MGTPKRYTNGITDVASSDVRAAIGNLDPTKWSVYHEDFSAPGFGAATLTAGATGYTGQWFKSTGANATGVTIADAGSTGCVLLISNGGANDNEQVLIQHAGGAMVMASGKKFFMEAKFEITSATISDGEMMLGLSTETATLDANWFLTNGTARAFDDGVGWLKVDGTDDIVFIVGEADVYDTNIVIATPVTATWYIVSMYYDGTDIYLYVDGVLVAKMTPDQIPVTKCAPTIYWKSGKAEAATLAVDYLTIAAEM